MIPRSQKTSEKVTYLGRSIYSVDYSPVSSPEHLMNGGLKKRMISAYMKGETEIFIPSFHIGINIHTGESQIFSRNSVPVYGSPAYGISEALERSLAEAEDREAFACLEAGMVNSMRLTTSKSNLEKKAYECVESLEEIYKGGIQVIKPFEDKIYILPPRDKMGVICIYQEPYISIDGEYLVEEIGMACIENLIYSVSC